MNYKKWIILWFITLPLVAVFNYIVDPYELYNTNLISKDKIKLSGKIRLVKAIKTREIKPVSICLGTSRVEYGCDPTHEYFLEPAYNLGISSGSIYENKLNFENALSQGNLKKVLLVIDYRMFNEEHQKDIHDLETFFEKTFNIYKYLFSIDTLEDSIFTLKGGDAKALYLDNGQIEHEYNWNNIIKGGGHLESTKITEKEYYKGYSTDYTYGDTKNKSFPDFESIVKDCYKNNIELDIIFGPSHIRMWESFDYHLGYDKWHKWKKDIVLSVNKISNEFSRKQFRIMDFSVYHPLTNEKIPINKNIKMKYYWESSHYNNRLGTIVLDRLIGTSEFENFGIKLNLKTIDAHLNQQKINRYKFIDIKKHQTEVWGKVKYKELKQIE